MAKAIVTQERVFEVAQALLDKGVDPTILTVQAEIGAGSYSTVKRYLDQWKESGQKRRAQVELPEPAVTRLMALGREFWALLDEQAAAQVESIRAGARDEIAGIQVQLDQAEAAISKLEAERDQLEQVAQDRQAQIDTLQREAQAQSERAASAEARAAELEARLGDLKTELALAHDAVQAERRTVETVRAEGRQQLEAAETKAATTIAQAAKDHKAELESVRRDAEKRLAELKNAHDAALQELRTEARRAAESLQKREAERDEARAQAATAGVELGKLQGECAALRSQVQQMQETIARLSEGKGKG